MTDTENHGDYTNQANTNADRNDDHNSFHDGVCCEGHDGHRVLASISRHGRGSFHSMCHGDRNCHNSRASRDRHYGHNSRNVHPKYISLTK